MKLLTAAGADIHTQDTNGNSPISIALAGNSEMLEAVVNETNAGLTDSNGNTPLHLALICDAPLAKIQYIISLMKDVNTRNKDGNSALFLSILKNRQKVGELLLAKNADIFSTNTNNNSPLRLALKYGGTVQDWLRAPAPAAQFPEYIFPQIRACPEQYSSQPENNNNKEDFEDKDCPFCSSLCPCRQHGYTEEPVSHLRCRNRSVRY